MFTITSEDVLQQVVQYGRAYIKYKVDGYWSNDIITVYIDRRWNNENWKIYDSHSAGGTDDKFDGPEWERTRNFAHAMFDAADKIQFWSENTALLDEAEAKYKVAMEAHYQEQARLKEAARLAAEEADRLDRIENPSMGVEAATQIAAELKQLVADPDRRYAWREVYRRDNKLKVTAEVENSNGKTRFYLNTVAMSKAHFIKTLSHDFVVIEKVAA